MTGQDGIEEQADGLAVDVAVVAVLADHFRRTDAAVPTRVLDDGLAELARAVSRQDWGLDPAVVERLADDAIPPPPPGLLEAGLGAIRAAVDVGEAGASGGLGDGVVVPMRRRPSDPAIDAVRFAGRFEARLAAAASGAVAGEIVGLAGDDELTAQWERRSDGSVGVTIRATSALHAGLVLVGWGVQGADDGDALATPLASGADGAFVRYDVLPPGSDGIAIELGAPATVSVDEVPLDAVRRAFEGTPRGVAIRAWQEFLAAGGVPPALAATIGAALGEYEN